MFIIEGDDDQFPPDLHSFESEGEEEQPTVVDNVAIHSESEEKLSKTISLSDAALRLPIQQNGDFLGEKLMTTESPFSSQTSAVVLSARLKDNIKSGSVNSIDEDEFSIFDSNGTVVENMNGIRKRLQHSKSAYF